MIFHLFKGIFFDRLLTNHLSCKNALKIEIWTLKNKKNDTFLNQIEISIKDDGKGFDKENANLGNGLRNMTKRAQEIGAQFQIDSKENHGTTVRLVINKT